MAPEFGVTELSLTNENMTRSKEMEPDDIEDGEILEDESNSSEPVCQNNVEHHEEPKARLEVQNTFENFFHKEKKSLPDPRKSSRRDRFPGIRKKRKRMSSNESMRSDKYYGKKNKCDRMIEEPADEDMIFMLGGPLRDSDRKTKHPRKPILPDPPDDLLDPMIFNEGENEDPRPYSRRSPPIPRRDKLKKDRGIMRGVNVSLMKRRGRGGSIMRKERPRDSPNDMCSYFAQGKCQRGSECTYSHAYNQPRKLEVCKFYLDDCCNKRDKCIYMHADFPCKYYHTPGMTCYLGKNCKFSHGKLDEVQRAVLKKYADIPLKELDEMQRYYRENSNSYSARNKEKVKDSNSRIPSLFDIKVSVPPEFRGTDDILNQESVEGNGVTTPIPSPHSMMDENDLDEKPFSNMKHHQHKILSEHNDHFAVDDFDIMATEPVVMNDDDDESYHVHHKKKHKKHSDDGDGEKSKKHSEKRKKKSKKDDKKSEKKKKKEHKRNKNKGLEMDGEEEAFPRLNHTYEEDPFELSSEEKSSHKHEQKEPTDALSHLPKKQQELFLRIQQHQKEAESSQNSNIEDQCDEEDAKPDENWYSSDEEPEQTNVTASPLATLLRTIQTSTCNVPESIKHIDSISTRVDSFLSITSSSSPRDNDDISVDPSQLANISLSDEFTKILASIVKTEASSSSPANMEPSSSIVNSISPTTMQLDNESPVRTLTKIPFEDRVKANRGLPAGAKTEDVDLRLSSNLIGTSLFGGIDSSPKDIDLRRLPFKPVPVHDAANEIDASITSHAPIEYKLTPLPFIAKVNYAMMTDIARMCPNDPRFRRKQNTESIDGAQLLSAFNPNDPRHLLALKSMNESVRSDPRLTDTRTRSDPRLGTKQFTSSVKVDPRMTTDPRFDKEQVRPADFRDPRLSSRKFPETNPFAMNLPPMPPVVKDVSMPSRKEDPRLRFRANQNS